MNVKDVSALLGVSEKTIYRWVGDKKIPAYRVGDQVRFSRGEIIEWATANRVPVSPSISLEPDSETLPLPTLTGALELGGIFFHVEAADRDSALRSVVRALRLPRDIDSDLVFEMLRVREEMASTGVGGGIAIPHPRSPFLLHVDEPSVTLCLLEHPVDFGALDGVPVFALFTILSATARAHLHLLSRIAFALRDPGVQAAIQEPASRETLLTEFRRMESDLAAPADSQLDRRKA
jgi:PTS system nitrogen regulatory IIA component